MPDKRSLGPILVAGALAALGALVLVSFGLCTTALFFVTTRASAAGASAFISQAMGVIVTLGSIALVVLVIGVLLWLGRRIRGG